MVFMEKHNPGKSPKTKAYTRDIIQKRVQNFFTFNETTTLEVCQGDLHDFVVRLVTFMPYFWASVVMLRRGGDMRKFMGIC